MKMEGMWRKAEGGVPSLHQRWRLEDVCQHAELWKGNIRIADHRGQRKMIFSSLWLPQPGPLLWGLLLVTGNRSRCLLCCCSAHTHTCIRVYVCFRVCCVHWAECTQHLLSEPHCMLDRCPHLSEKTTCAQVLALLSRWQVEINSYVADTYPIYYIPSNSIA